MSPSQWLLLAFLSVLWGGSFLFVGVAVRELPPFTLVLARVATAALLLAPVLAIMGLRLPRGRAGWQPFLVMGLLNNVVPFTLIVSGQREIASGLASVLNATTPLFALIVARAVSRNEPLAANTLTGIALGIAGVGVLMGPEAVFGGGSSLLGMLLCLGGSLSYGLASAWGRRLRSTPPLVSATSQLICSTVMLAPIALLVDAPWVLPMPRPVTLLAVLGLAVLSTALAYVVFYRILAVSGPDNAMLVTLLIPLSGIWLGVTFLDETILPRHLLGAGIIALSLIVIDGRLFRRRGTAQ